eukprot:8591389-Lingulodinium_polyedra.AAC.1
MKRKFDALHDIQHEELKKGEQLKNISAEVMQNMIAPAPRQDNGHKSVKAEQDHNARHETEEE